MALERWHHASDGGGLAPRWRVACILGVAVVAGCAGGDDPTADDAPAEPFTVRFETTKGPVDIEFVPEWSPLGAARVHELAEMGFWQGARIYRVNERYAQFGYSGTPALDSVWISAGLPDEPTRASNSRGTVSFARGGPGTRSAILFVNRSDNTNLDELPWNGVVGFPPVGRVVGGMEAIDDFHDGYGDEPMQWEDSIAAVGNAFLDRAYPALDSIVDVTIR
ncbi:MAG: peptidylprolyl isomerase [Gemmatimonadetes bacterium]|nr:peptidylprolyl isomerase [Gemmatimonadota bacterium]